MAALSTISTLRPKQSYLSQKLKNLWRYHLQSNNNALSLWGEANIWQNINTRWARAIWQKQHLWREKSKYKKTSSKAKENLSGERMIFPKIE